MEFHSNYQVDRAWVFSKNLKVCPFASLSLLLGDILVAIK